ncbi:MAG: MarP family serine protease, partial [Acidimicrobiales bacterium]
MHVLDGAHIGVGAGPRVRLLLVWTVGTKLAGIGRPSKGYKRKRHGNVFADWDAGALNLFDALILVLIAAAAVGGYRAGFVTRVLSWIGLGLGVAVAVTVGPSVLEPLADTADPQIRALLTIGLFMAAASLGATLGEIAGLKLRRLIPIGPARQVDRAIGGVVGGFGVLILVWLLLPALSEVPGDISAQVRESVVARVVDRAAPTAPGPLQDLRNFVQDADFPRVFEDLRRAPSTGPPPEASGLDPAVEERVAASTVRVSGPACGRVLEGSGFSPEAGVIVTNAHVVAGVDRPTVQTPSGRRLQATVVAFDAQRDLAVLSVPNLGATALPVGNASVGDTGAVFGHPGGQIELEVSPARVEQRVNALGRNIYDNAVVRRAILVLAAELRPGDSGGALVNAEGTVIGVAFAIAPDDPDTAYALDSSELRAVLDEPRAGSVDTG